MGGGAVGTDDHQIELPCCIKWPLALSTMG